MKALSLNKLAVFVVILAFAVTPTFSIGTNSTIDSSFGEPCLVPVFHTNFRLPAEGGMIVRVGDELYFVQNYLPGCEQAGSSYPIVKGSNTVANTTPVDGTAAGSRTTNSNCYQ